MIALVLNAAEGRVQFVLARSESSPCPPPSPVCSAQSSAAGCALRLLGHETLDAPSRGTELLPPALADMVRRLELTPADIERIACVQGPGSFTGLRLVLSFAAALRRGCGAQLAGINYLHALSASLPHLPGMPTFRRVITHARRDLVHLQDFEAGNGEMKPLCKPQMLALSEALNGVPSAGGLLLGSGYTRNQPVLDNILPASGLTPVSGFEHPSPEALLDLAARATYSHADPSPLYLRPCDAVDNLPHIARKRGQSPAEAQQQLADLLRQPPAPLA